MTFQSDNHYLTRINLVLNHIRTHLTDDLSLDKLADVAGFSAFHFHRIFTTLTDETVHQCVLRLRLERAAALLKADPALAIGDAAAQCGFESASVFSRAFKRQYGMTARAWDRQAPLKNSKNGQVLDGFPRYTVEHLRDIGHEEGFQVYIREQPPQRLAYIRLMDSYSSADGLFKAYDRLLAWYTAHGGRLSATTVIGMSQDDPEVTPLKLCRYDICLTVPENWRGEGEVETRIMPACHLAYVRCIGDIFVVDRAWQYLYRGWLPRSRYVPDNLPAMEVYRRRPDEIGWETYDLEATVAVCIIG
jgi:AraC-like DNA-binding protein/DNA gyrase inhibitor GyrI